MRFRCVRSGNYVCLDNEDDIKHMRNHEGYVEIKDETHADETVQVQKAAPQEVLKKRGRPARVVGEL